MRFEPVIDVTLLRVLVKRNRFLLPYICTYIIVGHYSFLNQMTAERLVGNVTGRLFSRLVVGLASYSPFAETRQLT
jgi:hypothetical protein